MAALLSGCVDQAGSGTAGAEPSQARSKRPTHRASQSPPPAGQHGKPPARGPVSVGWLVYDVVDGDTVKVAKGRRDLTVRLIGIDTPETVAPGQPVECFGPQASRFAKRQLSGRRVAIEMDPTQGRLDYYGRTLAYVWVTPSAGGGWMFNRRALRLGYAFEYTYDDPYLWQREFQRAERLAAADGLGLWAPDACP